MIFNGEKQYNDFGSFIKQTFSGRVQKLTLNTGFSCPNRDGTKGIGGCTYCNNNSFNPDYCEPKKSITQQLNEGIDFFSKKYKSQNYFAYFQAYTNTYADIKRVKKLYIESLNHPQVIGLIIGTRPDCISEELIDFLEELAKSYFVSLEFGVESTIDRTLLEINRCHTYDDTKKAYELCANRGIHLGAHIMIGLPGESKEEIINHAKELSKLPINTLKIHQLQIVKHTMMAKQFRENPAHFKLFELNEYIELIAEFITFLRNDIIIDRFISQSPPNLIIAPKWDDAKNFEVVDKIDKYLITHNLWQGKAIDNENYKAR